MLVALVNFWGCLEETKFIVFNDINTIPYLQVRVTGL